MISYLDNVFHLQTGQSSYIFQVTAFGHLENIHYGERVQDQPFKPLQLKRSATVGGSIVYDPGDEFYSLDNMTLEWSGIGKGDFREPPAELKMPDGTYVHDFIYQSHQVFDGPIPLPDLPTAHGTAADCQTLVITLQEKVHAVQLLLYYTVYPAVDVITRRVILVNETAQPVVIRKLMSLMLDLPNRQFALLTLHGGWIKETHRQLVPLAYGVQSHSSMTGTSSNRHNPGFLLIEDGGGEHHGHVYGFNLVYSGNHYAAVERTGRDLVRVLTGISPHCFEWILQPGSSFATPEAIVTFSNRGLNGASQQFHAFIQKHIIPAAWQDRERPVLLNSWEANFFRFNHWSLLHQARQARRLGIELFVLDDGWFGRRNNDKAGLGDYSVNRRKLPFGLAGLARRINRLGLQFGLWFEPEMVNVDSDLYRAHPEYVISIPGRQPAFGRNQLVLDLCQPAVRDYIVTSVRQILDSAPVSYVKWDMNRNLSDMFSPALTNQGEFYHRYVLGLYDVLRRIFADRPDILLESCSSGGNRFDLGMLCYSPQIWVSDDTDPVERLAIQSGLSYLYPPSTMGAHVSDAPHQQTLRQTPLATRFNVACFGLLGYELNTHFLSFQERRVIRAQIAFYKQHRQTLQFGRFFRLPASKANQVHWQVISRDGREAVAGFFQTLATVGDSGDCLPLTGLETTTRYVVQTVPQVVHVSRFGGLINHLLPFQIHPDGWLARLANHYYSLPDCIERYTGYGDMLQAGIRLNNQFMGTFYNTETRLLGDFGSSLYLVQAQ